jgi:hypothetical protein
MPPLDLTPDELQILVGYARRKYRAERWPLAYDLRPLREVLAKLAPPPRKPAPEPQRSVSERSAPQMPPHRGMYGRKLWPGRSKRAEPAA